MATHDAASARIEPGTVERVRDFSHQSPTCTDGQARICVQRYDIAYSGRYGWFSTVDCQKRGVQCAAQQSIEFVKLAALAFPSDPLAFPVVPDTAPVQKQKARAAFRAAVVLVQSRDSCC